MYRTRTEMRRDDRVGTTAKSRLILDLQEQSETARRDFSNKYRQLLLDRGLVKEKLNLRNFIQV